MEIWKDIIGFEGLYKISNLGRVKSLGKGKSTNPLNCVEKIMKNGLSKRGYEKIKLMKDGSYYYHSIHRLVAINFIDNPENKPQVNHIDGNKSNNKVSNLEWNTPKENIQHSFDNGLNIQRVGKDSPCSKQVFQLDLDGNILKEWGSINEIKRELGYNSTGISRCCRKMPKYNTAYGYKWEYKKKEQQD